MLPLFQLNPRYPRVWQSPTTLQIGINPPKVILDNVPDQALALLHALESAIPRTAAQVIAGEAGLPRTQMDTLLAALAPVMEPSPEAPAAPMSLGGALVHLPHLEHALAMLGHRVTRLGAKDEVAEGEVVLASNFVLEPQLYRHWLRQDRCHTPVIFSDQCVTIGPRVIPGVTACLHCLWEDQCQREPATPAIASQLWGRISASDTAVIASHTAWWIQDLLTRSHQGEVITLNALTREVTYTQVEPSERCSCVRLDS